jgi:hypothetical protein
MCVNRYFSMPLERFGQYLQFLTVAQRLCPASAELTAAHKVRMPHHKYEDDSPRRLCCLGHVDDGPVRVGVWCVCAGDGRRPGPGGRHG